MKVRVIEIIQVKDDLVFQVDLDLLGTCLLDLIDPIKVAAEIEEMDETLRTVTERDYYRRTRGFFRRLFRRKPLVFPNYLLDKLVERIREKNSKVLSMFLNDLLVSLHSIRLHKHVDVILLSRISREKEKGRKEH